MNVRAVSGPDIVAPASISHCVYTADFGSLDIRQRRSSELERAVGDCRAKNIDDVVHAMNRRAVHGRVDIDCGASLSNRVGQGFEQTMTCETLRNR